MGFFSVRLPLLPALNHSRALLSNYPNLLMAPYSPFPRDIPESVPRRPIYPRRYGNRAYRFTRNGSGMNSSRPNWGESNLVPSKTIQKTRTFRETQPPKVISPAMLSTLVEKEPGYSNVKQEYHSPIDRYWHRDQPTRFGNGRYPYKYEHHEELDDGSEDDEDDDEDRDEYDEDLYGYEKDDNYDDMYDDEYDDESDPYLSDLTDDQDDIYSPAYWRRVRLEKQATLRKPRFGIDRKLSSVWSDLSSSDDSEERRRRAYRFFPRA